MAFSSTFKSWLVNNVERLSALVTWLFVSVSSLYFLIKQLSFWHWRPISAFITFSLIAVCFVLVTRHDHTLPRWRFPLLWAIYVLAIASQFLLPYAYIAIFVVIWSAVLPYFMSWGKCLLLSIPLALPTVLIQALVWNEEQAMLTGALFWTFNLFAMMMANTAIKEGEAREKADALNRQLVSTQHLVKQAITQDERLRIARNIHDVLGHHLTALTINLQVASRKSEVAQNSEVKAHVDQCHAIAKLLLSDVREAISDIREHATIDFEEAVHLLVKDLPRPKVTMSLQSGVMISDVKIADALLRLIQEGVTNVIRHTQSTTLSISLSKIGHVIHLTMQDSQQIPNRHIVEGNGLIGMRERVSALGGELTASFNDIGFCIHATLTESE
jgi:signal transduction histidine kinase